MTIQPQILQFKNRITFVFRNVIQQAVMNTTSSDLACHQEICSTSLFSARNVSAADISAFLDTVSEKENGAAAKPTPPRRARRVGEPLRRIDRPAAKRPAKPGPRPAPKPNTEKRRRIDDPAQEAAPGPDKAQSSSDKGDGAGDLFDLYVSYPSSCFCLSVGMCLSTSTTETK